MNIYDLDVKRIKQSLDKELGEEYFWDLSQSTFKSRNDVSLNYWYVQQDEDMRIDLICYRIYDNTDNIDILLNVNRIDNPLNIKSGDVLRYPSESDIYLFRVTEDEKQSVQKLLNRNKAPRKDSNRKDYVEKNYSLPPTVLQVPTEPVSIVGKDIVIGGGLLPS